ncbi:MAG: glycosyltransferase [Cytophagaceae bacterium]|nr:MAG: glycosyltransferase [Cytophagaceae bacterium]
MKILISGPVLTSAIADATCINLTDLPPGTTQTPIAPLAAALISAGHEVHLVTLDPSIDEVQSYERDGLRMTFCPLRGAPRFKARHRMKDLFAVEIAHLTRVIAQSDADIVHAHWTYEHAEAALRSGKPYLVTMHDLGWDYLFLFRDAYRLMRLAMKYRAMMRVRNLTVVGEFMLGKAWQYGFRGKADFVPNPIGPADWRPKVIEAPVFVAVGNPNAIKNIPAAIAAFELLQFNNPAAELHLFGPGLDAGYALAQGVRGVIMHGNVEHRELMRFLAEHATVLIHPSRLETFGVIIAEAKMRGVPAIAGLSAKGTLDAIGDVGTLCNIESPVEIAQAAQDIIADQTRYACLQRASHNDVNKRFSAGKVADVYSAIYRRVINEAKQL